MSTLLSVIIPIYGVEKELIELLPLVDKIMDTDIEIILIDDGSPDESGKIADAFANEHSGKYVQSLHKKNGGLSDARNYGLNAAKGEYIWLVDSDDLFDTEGILRIIDRLRNGDKDKIDLVLFDHIDFVDPNDVTQNHHENEDHFVQAVDATKLLAKLSKSEIENYVWSYIFRRDILENGGIDFPVVRKFEDVPTTYKIFDAVKNGEYWHAPFYYYRTREGSIVNTATVQNSSDLLVSIDEIEAYFEKLNRLNEPTVQLFLFKNLALAYVLLHEAEEVASKEDYVSISDTINKKLLKLKVTDWPLQKRIGRLTMLFNIYLPAVHTYSFIRTKILRKER